MEFRQIDTSSNLVGCGSDDKVDVSSSVSSFVRNGGSFKTAFIFTDKEVTKTLESLEQY
jgi:hypothetical protein